MAEPAGQQSTTLLPWWVRVCRVGWKVVRYFWATFLLTLVLPKAVEMLFSDKPLRSLPNLWPLLEVIIDHPLWTLLTFLGLLVLTGLFWFGRRERTTTTRSTLSEHYMLKRLRRYYKQMLSQSLQGAVQVELGLAERPTAVQNAVSLSLHLPSPPEQLLSPHTSIIQAYELAQRELLILGEPGAGKSTQLLELAHHLVEQAERDVTQPLPVLLPLSSWATKRPPLHEWLVEQVTLLYHVPKGLSQQWLQGEQLLPLLDGLDEVEVSQRAACIAKINTYHHEHLQSLVVCSRTSEYEAAARHERLALHSAVVVQPLSKEQVDVHLEHLGKPVAALRTAVRKNPVLQELATTPLMVQVLVLTYHGVSIRALSQKEAQLRKQIWTDYVECMVSQKGDRNRYPLNRTRAWLSFLARQMREHNQTIFFLERLQPDWLPKGYRTFYQLSVVLIIFLIVILFGDLSWMLVFGLPKLFLKGSAGVTFGVWLEALLGTSLLGMCLGISFGLFYGQRAIQPFEALSWSWKDIWSRLLAGLVIALSVGTCFLLSKRLATGFSGKQITERTHLSPNEGLQRSAKNGLLVGLFVGPVVGVFWGMVVGVLTRLLIFGLPQGLFYGLVLGLLVGMLFGLGAFIQHYVLRFWLARSHTFPWGAIPFLDDSSDRILLRRVGGGYSFSHRLLLDYFADLDTQVSPTSIAVPSAPSPAP